VDKNHTTMQGISTPAGNHGNTPRVPAAVGSLASSRVSGLSNSSSSAIASLGDTSVATRRSPRLMECQRVEAIQQTGQVGNGNALVDAMNEAAQGNVNRKFVCDVDNCVGCPEKASWTCILCEAEVHPSCFTSQIRKLYEYPTGCHNEVFCSSTCCLWHSDNRISVDDVRKERQALSLLLKKNLIELARNAKVRVTQRIDGKSLQVSKAMMVRRLVAAKFNPLLGDSNPDSGVPTRKERTVHVRFRLINCLFSDELSRVANEADNVDRSALDSGEVGANSQYWKLVEDRFNSGFPVESVDGPQFADKVHFSHPTIKNFHENVDPKERCVFSSSELRSLWSDIQKEYEKVFINFKKSGNHNSSFTKEAMLLYRRENQEVDDFDDESMSSFDRDDVFGVEEGGFCCFTNSIVIIYLRLWLNERPGLTRFVNRQLPAEIQVDSMKAPAKLQSQTSNVSDGRDSARRSPDIFAKAISELAKARKLDNGKKEMHDSIATMALKEAKKVEVETQLGQIKLLQAQLAAAKQRMECCTDPEKLEKYRRGYADLEDKLDSLLFNST
jgi:hypothetical protein